MVSILTLIINFILLGFLNAFTSGITTVEVYTFFILVQSFAFFSDVSHSNELSDFQVPLSVAYFWRVFLIYFDVYGRDIYTLPNSGADSSMYYSTSVNYVYTNDPGRGELFSRVMGTIFSIVGSSKLYGQYIIMMFSMVSLCILSLIISKLEIEKKIGYRVIAVVGLLPNFAILSSIFLRESIVTMFISISLYCFFLWITEGKENRYILAFAFILIASLFHSGSIAIVIGYVVVRFLYDKRMHCFHLSASSILTSVIFVIIIAFLYLNYGDVLFSKLMNVSSVSDIANTSTEGGSSYAKFVGNSNNIFNMIIYTIPRIIYFLFSPFPWQWRGLSDIIAFLFSSLFYWFSTWKALCFIRSGEEKNRYLVIAFLIVAFCAVFVFAWGVSNTGTAARHREKMIILFGIIYALCSNEENMKFPSIFFKNKRIL